MTELVAIDGLTGAGKSSTAGWLEENTDAVTGASKPAYLDEFYSEHRRYGSPLGKDLILHQLNDDIASGKAESLPDDRVFIKDRYLLTRMVESRSNDDIREGKALETFRELGCESPDINFYFHADNETLERRIRNGHSDDYDEDQIERNRELYDQCIEILDQEFENTDVIPVDTSSFETAGETGIWVAEKVGPIDLYEKAVREKAF